MATFAVATGLFRATRLTDKVPCQAVHQGQVEVPHSNLRGPGAARRRGGMLKSESYKVEGIFECVSYACRSC